MVISENCCTFIVPNYKVVQTIIAMFTEDKVTEIFFIADEFYKVFCRMLDKYSLNTPKTAGKRSYHRAGRFSVPEIMTIMILFHNSGYRCLKHFYLNEVCVNLRHLFPQVVSYNRFVELENRLRLRLCRRRRRSYRSPSLSRRYFWENAPASVLLTPRLCVCAG